MDIGIIGTGAMGKHIATFLANAGFRVNCCDKSEYNRSLTEYFSNFDGKIRVLENGSEVSRVSDFIYYLVETENIESAVRDYAGATKEGAVVASGTSVMSPAIDAFKKYVPKDVGITTFHLLHGPTIKPAGQIAVSDDFRISTEKFEKTVIEISKALRTNLVVMDYLEHDRITADTQVNTHVAFESMGAAWVNSGCFPWETPTYSSGLDNAKIAACLSIFANKSHVYSGLAFTNPFAMSQVSQYSQSVSDLFTMIIKDDREALENRLMLARDVIYGSNRVEPLIGEKIMETISMSSGPTLIKPNSHLSILGCVDAWRVLDIDPYHNQLCKTPMSRLRLGIAQYLFEHEDILKDSINAAINEKSIRGDDFNFTNAANRWATIIRSGSRDTYKDEFLKIVYFFGEPRLQEGLQKRNALLNMMRPEPDMERITYAKSPVMSVR